MGRCRVCHFPADSRFTGCAATEVKSCFVSRVFLGSQAHLRCGFCPMSHSQGRVVSIAGRAAGRRGCAVLLSCITTCTPCPQRTALKSDRPDSRVMPGKATRRGRARSRRVRRERVGPQRRKGIRWPPSRTRVTGPGTRRSEPGTRATERGTRGAGPGWLADLQRLNGQD